DVLPESNRKPYDVEDVIRRIVDDGEYLSLKPQWAKTIVTCLARFGGRPVGIVANQPRQLGGILDNDSADKAARFVNLCNAFGLPLVFLQDVPGFMVGTKVEEAGIIRRQVDEADDPAAKKAELVDAYRQIIDVYIAAKNGMVDDVIDPRETRPVICRALEMAEGKVAERPWKRNAVVPV